MKRPRSFPLLQLGVVALAGTAFICAPVFANAARGATPVQLDDLPDGDGDLPEGDEDPPKPAPKPVPRETPKEAPARPAPKKETPAPAPKETPPPPDDDELLPPPDERPAEPTPMPGSDTPAEDPGFGEEPADTTVAPVEREGPGRSKLVDPDEPGEEPVTSARGSGKARELRATSQTGPKPRGTGAVGRVENEGNPLLSNPLLLVAAGGLGAAGVATVIVVGAIATAVVVTIVVVAMNPALLENLPIPGMQQKQGSVKVKVN